MKAVKLTGVGLDERSKPAAKPAVADKTALYVAAERQSV
jgi:hypothetical protein